MRRLTEPLLSSDSDSDSSNGDFSISSDPELGNPRYREDEFEPQSKPLVTQIKETVIFVTALSAVGSSLMYMAVSTNMIAYLSSILCCVIAPYSWYQQKDLYEIQKLNESCETIKKVVEDINTENSLLTETVNNLDKTQERIGDVHEVLDLIENSQGKSVKEISRQIDTNQTILRSIEKNYKVTLWQNILLVMKVVDVDKDASLSDKEVRHLLKRLKKVNGVAVDEAKFREMLKKTNRELWEVMNILKEMYEPH